MWARSARAKSLPLPGAIHGRSPSKAVGQRLLWYDLKFKCASRPRHDLIKRQKPGTGSSHHRNVNGIHRPKGKIKPANQGACAGYIPGLEFEAASVMGAPNVEMGKRHPCLIRAEITRSYPPGDDARELRGGKIADHQFVTEATQRCVRPFVQGIKDKERNNSAGIDINTHSPHSSRMRRTSAAASCVGMCLRPGAAPASQWLPTVTHGWTIQPGGARQSAGHAV